MAQRLKDVALTELGLFHHLDLTHKHSLQGEDGAGGLFDFTANLLGDAATITSQEGRKKGQRVADAQPGG
jgi:hypothetical protein